MTPDLFAEYREVEVPVETMPDEEIPPYVRIKVQRWCPKFHRPCYSYECTEVCMLAP